MLSNTSGMSRVWKARNLPPSSGEPQSSWYAQVGAAGPAWRARASSSSTAPRQERPAVVAAKNTSDGV